MPSEDMAVAHMCTSSACSRPKWQWSGHDMQSAGVHLHEGISVDGDKALGAVGAHLAPPAPVCRYHRLEHLRPLLERNEKGRMPADQHMPQVCVPSFWSTAAAIAPGLPTSHLLTFHHPDTMDGMQSICVEVVACHAFTGYALQAIW